MSELYVHNTLSRSSELFEPAVPGQVRMYVCGMTTYDYCHIGHARAMISFDVVYRWLINQGYQVTYVRNHTDVDDKIIARARQVGEEPLALSARFIAVLDEDLGRLGMVPPTIQPKVTEHIPEIREIIQQLLDGGHAYASDGDVYFSVETCPDYGHLSGRTVADVHEGDNGEASTRKRHPADFALWKGVKAGEEGAVWDAPWGRGRPGWHIECSAMARRYLGETFDIHGGGIDLVFPHHENEIAQSECATGHRPMARYWLHNGHLMFDSGKMSKSIGNTVLIREILDQVPAEALRLLYVESHYRSPLPYTGERLEDALASLDRLYQAKETLEEMAAEPATDSAAALMSTFGEPARELAEAADTFQARFTDAMNEDFNTALALSALYELARAANRLGNQKKARKRAAALAKPALAAFQLAGEVLGLGGRPPADHFVEVRRKRLAAMGHSESEIEDLVSARWKARTEKRWPDADRLRDELVALGVVLMDGSDGTRWRMRIGEAPAAG